MKHPKLVSFSKLAEIIVPNSAILISGSFEPFNGYYFRLLRWASRQGRPLVVIAQRDDMVLKRRGFLPLTSNHSTRASIISALEFVDYVVVANKTAHDNYVIDRLKPNGIVFQRDALEYRKILAKKIRQDHPNIFVKYAPFVRNSFSFSSQKRMYSRSKDKIIQDLLQLSATSKGKTSKISALLVNKGKKAPLLVASNNSYEDHAELLLLEQIKKNNLELDSCAMYILIPPCLMCAKEIAKTSLKNIHYIYPYGDGAGIEFLREKGIKVERYEAKS